MGLDPITTKYDTVEEARKKKYLCHATVVRLGPGNPWEVATKVFPSTVLGRDMAYQRYLSVKLHKRYDGLDVAFVVWDWKEKKVMTMLDGPLD